MYAEFDKRTGIIKIVESVRDLTKKSGHTTVLIEKLGKYDELAKAHKDPIGYARKRALQLTEEKNAKKAEYNITLNLAATLPLQGNNDTRLRRNIGYAAFSYLYHELEIDEFIDNRRRYTKQKYNANSVFKMLVYSRLLFPGSKRNNWMNRGRFFEDTEYTLDNVYNCLDFLLSHREALLQKLHEQVERKYHRDTLLLFYDVTNYYCEIDENDEDGKGIRRKGYSKEHRTSPIVQMGLFMDEQGLPLSYELFEGNRPDCKTLMPMLDESFSAFDMSHTIVIADKGMMSGDNLRDLIIKHKGYIISSSVRKADKQFTEYVLDDDGYYELYDEETKEVVFKYKSRTTPRYIKVTNEQTGGKATCRINEHQIVFWSRDYAEREKKARDKVLEKTERLAFSSSSDANTLSYGSRKYIVKKPVNRKGEIIDVNRYVLSLDEDKINEDEALDGYYAICTNVRGIDEDTYPFKEGQRYRWSKRDGFLEMNRELHDLEIVEMYHGLWRIEETFRVSKSDLEARPFFMSREDRIRAHFLTCFVALLLMRLLQFRLDWKYSASEIQRSLSLACCSHISGNIFNADYYNECLRDIGNNLGIDFSRKYLSLGEIKNLIAQTKK